MAPKPKLTASSVYCRIRPLAATGGHAAVPDAEADVKTLEAWDDSSVTIATGYTFSKGKARYTFPKQVFPPECVQQDVYDGTMPALVDAFIGGADREPHNVLFLAYGQTGTGKTHTMFGTDSSLRAASTSGIEPDWGLLPRVAHAVFDAMRGRRFLLSGQAVEFYCCTATDLLSDPPRVPVMLDSDSLMPKGCATRHLESMQDVLEFIAQVRENRTSRSTRMNEAGAGHEGSSRSHAALLLWLLQQDPSTQKVSRSHFALVDLAGAERPSKTGEERKSGIEAMLELMQGKTSIGAEGMFINYELSLMRSAIVTATDAHKRNKTYNGERTMSTALIKFISGSMLGRARLGMCVTLSPSGRNGWETWFSLEYAQDMAVLRVPLYSVGAEEGSKMLTKADASAVKAFAALQATPEKGSPASKYYAARLALALSWSELVVDLYTLLGASAGSPDVEGASESGSPPAQASEGPSRGGGAAGQAVPAATGMAEAAERLDTLMRMGRSSFLTAMQWFPTSDVKK